MSTISILGLSPGVRIAIDIAKSSSIMNHQVHSNQVAPVEVEMGNVSFSSLRLDSSGRNDRSTDDETSSVSSSNIDLTNDIVAMEQSKPITTTGCWGFLEKIPIQLKLFCMNMAPISVSVTNGQMVHELQKERGLSNFFLTSRMLSLKNQTRESNSLELLERVKEQRNLSDIAVERVKEINSQIDSSLYGPFARNLTKQLHLYLDRLPLLRMEIIDNISIGIDESFEFYTKVIDLALDVSMILGSSDPSQETLLFNTLLMYIEKSAAHRGKSVEAFEMSRFTAKTFNAFIMYVSQQEILKKQIRVVSAQEDWDFLTSTVSGPEVDAVNNMISYSMGRFGDEVLEINPYHWWDNYTAKINLLNQVATHWNNIFVERSHAELVTSISQVIFTVLVIVFCFCISVFLSICVAHTIVVPWKRLNHAQEQVIITIYKFVPRGFLNLVKCKKITDVKLGASVQKELAILFGDIRNFTEISESLTVEQNFSFLNDYLSYVGPVIRQNGGYIDKYIGDGIMALFLNPTAALRASQHIQRAVQRFNLDNTSKDNIYPVINVGIGVHFGKVLAGAIGEHERMDGTIISDAVNLASRLEGLTKFYKCKIICSESALQDKQSITYRYLGKVRVKGKSKPVDIYEILDFDLNFADPIEQEKVRTRDLFSRAVNHMVKNEYEDAISIFRAILITNPSDHTASIFVDLCLEHSNSKYMWDGVQAFSEK